MSRLSLYFHTLRYLKLIQIWGRVVFFFRRPRPDLRPAPVLRDLDGEWAPPVSQCVTMFGPMRFRFLNEEHEVSSCEDWNSPDLSKLWLYNLHYFDDLNASGARERKVWHDELFARWLAENLPAKGNGWEPYPLSLRIVNWVKWALAGNKLSEAAIHSLAVQARFLSGRLERHLLGNHLFTNAKALVFAGCFFEGEEANAWLRLGMGIVNNEIFEQVLADGGHFERSTMYHALTFEDMLDLLNLAGLYPTAFKPWAVMVAGWPLKTASMANWLATMCHTDGEISFFNDAAMGVAPSPPKLMAYARRLNVENKRPEEHSLVWLKDSGYVSAERNGAVLIADVALVGPNYLPAHAHADTLSFEFSLRGQRVFVNSGTSRYGLGLERQWERSTAAHNTVEIDGQNSSEVWGGFRVAQRAYPFDITVTQTGYEMLIAAAHDGYLRLPGRNIHRRKWLFRTNSLIIEDELTGSFHEAVARFYLHPDVKIGGQELNEGRLVLQLPHGDKLDFAVEGGALSLDSTLWHPCFGVSAPNLCLSVNFHATSVKTELKWQGSDV